jgi:RNA polymerase-interacting CarD/CdnL/TRCF family regulator
VKAKKALQNHQRERDLNWVRRERERERERGYGGVCREAEAAVILCLSKWQRKGTEGAINAFFSSTKKRANKTNQETTH